MVMSMPRDRAPQSACSPRRAIDEATLSALRLSRAPARSRAALEPRRLGLGAGEIGGEALYVGLQLAAAARAR